MSKINLKYEGKEYTLEFNRQTVRTLESQGFNPEEVGSKPVTMIPLLFSGAFEKNHRGMKRTLRDEIYEAIPDKSSLLQALFEMYVETLATLTADNLDADSEGNVSWAVVN